MVTVIAMLAVGCREGTAAAAPFDLRGQDWEGLSQFLRIAELECGNARVAVSSTLDLRRLSPEDALVIVHPTRPIEAEELSAFMQAGGRVVLLDDYGDGDGLLALFHTRRRALPARPAQMLRGNPALAIAEPGADHPIVRDVAHVVVNHGTGLENPALSPILIVRGDSGDDVVFGIAGTVGRGRFVAMGDGSIIMNSMIRYPGNRALAMGLVRYALEDDTGGRRAGTLYVLANDFATTGSFGGNSPLWSAADEARRGVLESFRTLRREGMSPSVAYLAAVAMAVGVIVWTGTRAGKTHKFVTPRFVREVPVVAQGGIAGHAATLGSPGASRALAVLELKSALEEELATHLGLERAPPPEQLVARLQAGRLLDENAARALLRIFTIMTAVEAKFARRAVRGGWAASSSGAPSDAPRDRDVLALAAAVRDVRGRMGLPPLAALAALSPPAAPGAGRDTFEKTP